MAVFFGSIRHAISATLFVFLFSTFGMAQDAPQFLREAFLNREKYTTLDVVYTYTIENPPKKYYSKTRWHERRAGSNALIVQRNSLQSDSPLKPGEDFPDGQTPRWIPQCELIRTEENEKWRWGEGLDMAYCERPGISAGFDGRLIGLLPYHRSDCTPTEALKWIENKHNGNGTWRVDKTESEIVITLSGKVRITAEKTEEIVWHLDRGIDNACVKIEWRLIGPDGAAAKGDWVETRYKKTDGRWWPQRSELINGPKRVIIEVESASFDKPEHPKLLGLESANWEAGTELRARPEFGWSPGESRYWSGSAVVNREEWERISYEKWSAPAVLAITPYSSTRTWWMDQSGSLGVDRLSVTPGEWDVFVRRWCLLNKVDVEQRRAAGAILSNCKDRALEILQRNKSELEEIERALSKAINEKEKRDSLFERRRQLTKPIEELLSELKSRLALLIRVEQQAQGKAITGN